MFVAELQRNWARCVGMKKMINGKRIQFSAREVVTLEAFQLNPPGDREILTASVCSTISPGTEKANLLALLKTDVARNGFPFSPGYSCVARVVAVGNGVTEFREGQLVAHMGSHASHHQLSTERDLIWPLPAGVSEASAREVSAFGVAVVGLAGARRAGVDLGEPSIVLGLGAVGLSTAYFLRFSGSFPVVGIDPSAVRRAVAQEAQCVDIAYGAGHELAGIGQVNHVGLIVDATGSPTGVRDAFDLCDRGGRVVLVGSTRSDGVLVDIYGDIHREGRSLIGAHQMVRPRFESSRGAWTQADDCALLIRLCLQGRISLSWLQTHSFAPEDAAAAYAAVLLDENALCVRLDWA
jgi:2-desacetyl-2-hydroxyethyl bacteriochlorophyllide A dehydrogenase